MVESTSGTVVSRAAKHNPLIEPAAPISRNAFGERLRHLRREQGWTLEQASAETGVAKSTLSKIENGGMSPTFDLIQKIAAGLRLDLVDLVGAGGSNQGAAARRSLMQGEQGPLLEGKAYVHELLASDLSHKKMLPFRTVVRARNLRDFNGKLIRHLGEVFLTVLEGSVMFMSEFYGPVELHAGHCIYFDGQMGHALISTSEQDAVVMWVSDNHSSVPSNIGV